MGIDLIANDKTNPKLTEGIDLFQRSWNDAKARRKKAKHDWMGQNIKGAKFSGKGSATIVYAKELDSMKEEKELLLETEAFKNKRLTLSESDGVISYHYKEKESDVSVQIGTLRLGNDAYIKSVVADKVAVRDVYHKRGFESDKTDGGNAKEYIEDSNHVKTRRYAYVEKNYYQMMDFLKTGKMTGRFQQNMKAGGASDGANTMTEGVKNKVIQGPVTLGQTLTPTQIAVAHQEMGSSPEQRGVSLSSTEKVGGTVGNSGENFRTEDGFRLKIDLARVPSDVLLLNHYGKGGLIDQKLAEAGIKQVTTDTNPKTKRPYKYGGSVRKNRELYLDHVKPEWVVEIEYHKKGGYDDGKTKETLIKPDTPTEDVNLKSLYEDYWAGFDAVLKKTALDALTSDAAQKGISSAKLMQSGYEAGSKKKPSVTAVKAHEEVAKSGLKDMFAQYHIGYIRGRVGAAMFKDSADYAQAMK
ncbi:MAG: hypothetical protein JXR76_21775 [Deltaproteobacteria bacterium]|nr:hypothetical protein [Deltaproteobacteria bacterium]